MSAQGVFCFLLVCWIVLLKSGRPVTGFTSGNETALRTALFTTSNYDVSVRPDHPTIVSLTLVPTSLNSIDIKAQTMSLSGWWIVAWPDSRLQWNPSNYGDISETHVFQDKVWTPTIVVYNSVNDLSAIDEDTIPVRIFSNGQLEWSPPSILTVSCSTDITHFPFDTQTCGVSVKTFGYTRQELVLEAHEDEMDLSYYRDSGEWRLLNIWTERVDNGRYSEVTFNFKFNRKPEYYGLNLIMPVLMMAVMGLFTFHLPVESDERMGYSLTVMLTFVVLMTLLADSMPATADHISYLEVYVVLVLILCALSVLFSILSLNLFFRDEEKPVPAKARDFTRLLMRCLCRSEPRSSKDPHRLASAAQVHVELSDKAERDRRQEESLTPGKEGAASSKPEVTWKKMSMVVDAFCFRVYAVVLVLLSVVFLALVASG